MAEQGFKEGGIRIDTFRSDAVGEIPSDSAVRVTHLPTGHTVTCGDSPAQHRNRKVGNPQSQYAIYPLRSEEEGLPEGEVRIRRCSEDIHNALERYGCRLDISILVTPRGNAPSLKVVLKEDFQGPSKEEASV